MNYNILERIKFKNDKLSYVYEDVNKRYDYYYAGKIAFYVEKQSKSYSLFTDEEFIDIYNELLNSTNSFKLKKLELISDYINENRHNKNINYYEMAIKIARFDDAKTDFMYRKIVSSGKYNKSYSKLNALEKEIITFIVNFSYKSNNYDDVIYRFRHNTATTKEEFDNIVKAIELGLLGEDDYYAHHGCLYNNDECKKYIEKKKTKTSYDNKLDEISEVFYKSCEDNKNKAKVYEDFIKEISRDTVTIMSMPGLGYFGAQEAKSSAKKDESTIKDIKKVVDLILNMPDKWFEELKSLNLNFELGNAIGVLFKGKNSKNHLEKILNPENSMEELILAFALFTSRLPYSSERMGKLLENIPDLVKNEYVIDDQLMNMIRRLFENAAGFNLKKKYSSVNEVINELLFVTRDIASDYKELFKRDSDWMYIYDVFFPYAMNSFDVFGGVEKLNTTAKIFDDTVTIPSYLATSYKNMNSYYYITDSGKVDFKSNFVLSNDNSMVLYNNINQEFNEKIYSKEDTQLVKNSEDILTKYPSYSSLIAKINGKKCILPAKGTITPYKEGIIIYLADGTNVIVDSTSLELMYSSENSEIINDILKQIADINEKILR